MLCTELSEPMRCRHKIIDTRQISQKRHEGTQHNHARDALRFRSTKASVVIIHSITRVTMIRNGQDCLTQVSYVRIIRTVVVSNLTRSEKHFSFFEKSVY